MHSSKLLSNQTSSKSNQSKHNWIIDPINVNGVQVVPPLALKNGAVDHLGKLLAFIRESFLGYSTFYSAGEDLLRAAGAKYITENIWKIWILNKLKNLVGPLTMPPWTFLYRLTFLPCPHLTNFLSSMATNLPSPSCCKGFTSVRSSGFKVGPR